MNELIACTNCGEKIKAKAILCRFCHRGLSTKYFRKCVFCAEMIRHAARKCRYCTSDLDPPQASAVPNDSGPAPQKESSSCMTKQSPSQTEGDDGESPSDSGQARKSKQTISSKSSRNQRG